jgi:hypothetical protein
MTRPSGVWRREHWPTRSCRLGRLVRDDGDRAGGVVQGGAADRAEQQPGEPAEAAGAHDGQLVASISAMRA